MRVHCGHFEHQRRVQFERCVAEPLQTITAILHGVAGRAECVHNFYPLLKLRVFVDDISALYEWEAHRVGGDGREGVEEVAERER